jgi:hypothetical protein
VVQSGTVKWPSLKYEPNGSPEYRFTLYRETQNADGQTFPLKAKPVIPADATLPDWRSDPRVRALRKAGAVADAGQDSTI